MRRLGMVGLVVVAVFVIGWIGATRMEHHDTPPTAQELAAQMDDCPTVVAARAQETEIMDRFAPHSPSWLTHLKNAGAYYQRMRELGCSP